MVESVLYSKGLDFYARITESIDDVLVAFLKALEGKADKNSEKVIQDFLKYVENGGNLKSIEVNSDTLQILSDRLSNRDISFISTGSADDDTLSIVHFKDMDEEKVTEVLRGLVDEGVKLQNTNRIELPELLKRTDKKLSQAVFTQDEFEKYRGSIHRTLNRELNVPYAIHLTPGGQHIVLSMPSSVTDELLKRDAFKNRVRRLDEKPNIVEVKKTISKAKEFADENKKKKEKKASKER